jgi:site-specific DNA-methyltransferase (adenine-specific)
MRGQALMAELVWKGKHQPHSENTFVTQEQTIHQNVRPHQLMTQAYYPAPPGVPTTVPGIPASSAHPWHNRLIQGDKCIVLPALQHEFKEAIDLIYIDPPFMTGRTFSSGTQLAYHDTWNNDLDSYLQWLYETLHLLHTLLARDGSLYVHLDWRTSHYAKMILDEIFGSGLPNDGAGFKNEIIWYYQSGGRSKKYFARKHDSILLYTKSRHYCFHSERVGIRRGTQKRNHMRKEVGADGRISWSIRSAGRIYTYSEDSTMSANDVWSDISHLHQRDPERTGYATQKPEALLERIMQASSEEQDLVLDCFCGSGVTPTVAEKLGRRWIASDQSTLAITTTRDRLLAVKQVQPFALQYVIETNKTPCSSQE